MTDGVPCTADPGRRPNWPDRKCIDCATPPGGLHHPGCGLERCRHNQQAITCQDCVSGVCNDIGHEFRDGECYWCSELEEDGPP